MPPPPLLVLRVGNVPSSPHNSVVLETKAHFGPNLELGSASNEVVLGAILECGKANFMDKFIVCALDGIEAILKNTFSDIYYVDVLKGGSKLSIIARLTNMSVSLKVGY